MELPIKEAKKIISEIRKTLESKVNKDIDMLWELTVHHQTIECALLMLNKIIEIASDEKSIIDSRYMTEKEYWKEVKKEVEDFYK
jgi:NifU-like protein involved in Fe-S cluster formation